MMRIKRRDELPWLYYPENDSVRIINSHRFPSGGGLLTDLVWYWDLDSADASITDQHSGLALPRVGSTTTSATGGPDGGPCIDFGAAAGKYRNTAVAKTIDYSAGFTANIWVKSTGTSSTGNWVFNHRDAGGGASLYWQMIARFSSGGVDRATVVDSSGASTGVNKTQVGLNDWQMWTLVDTGDEIQAWQDATKIATTPYTPTARATGTAGLAIGGQAWGDINGVLVDHRGLLAMAGVWSTPFGGAKILQLFNSGNGKRYADL